MDQDTQKNIRETPYDGKKAVIINEHPHADAVAICQRAELTYAGWGLVFKRVDDDTEFFVFHPENVKWI